MASSPDTEILTLWHTQAGGDHMRVNDIRIRAERFDARTRRWRIATVGLLVLVLVWEAWQVWTQEEMLERAGDLLTIAAFVYVAYRFRKRHLAAPPVTLGRTNCVDFYRAELVRQRDLSRDSWGYLLPFVPGVALALFGGGLEDRPVGQLIALVAFGVALFVGVAWWNARSARKLQNEIDALEPS
jgi:hypothetical protein